MRSLLAQSFCFFSFPFHFGNKNIQRKPRDSVSVTHSKRITIKALTMNYHSGMPNHSIFSCHRVYTTKAFQTILSDICGGGCANR